MRQYSFTDYMGEAVCSCPCHSHSDPSNFKWVYTTANTCHVAGYLDYDFPSTDWFSGQLPSCVGVEPERFWNCVEVK